MFGYINPDAPYLFKKDEVLYKSLYCGLCKAIGKGCGQMARTALTYDMAFISALVHNILGEDVKIEKKRCAVHWIKKRHVALPDDTSVALGYANTALAYYKLCDDKADGEARGALRHIYKKGFKRARKARPDIVGTIEKYLRMQAETEKSGCAVPDMAAEPTALMLSGLSDLFLKDAATGDTRGLFYAIGKWVYLVDALDDYDEDVKKGRYNVLYNMTGRKTKKEALEVAGEELKFIFDMLFADMRRNLSGISFKFNHDLTDNIILRGIPLKTQTIFYGDCGKKSKGADDEQKKS